MTKFYISLIILFLQFSPSVFSNSQTGSEVLYSASFRKIDGNKLICNDTVVIRINSREGESACNFALQYSKSDKLKIDNVTIEDASGRVVKKLKNNEILTRNSITDASTLYKDDFIKEFTLKHTVYPYYIKLCYTKTYKEFLIIDNWRPVQNIWENYNALGQPVQLATLTIDIPAGYKIRTKQENIEAPEIETIKDRKIFKWHTAYKGVHRENYAPYSALKIPEVSVYPVDFRYGVEGSWASWETFGDWTRRLNDKTQTLPTAEKTKVAHLLEGVKSEREKIEILYRYLQTTTRYVNVKIGAGGFRSYPADYVATNKYGDCKALSTYMIALLKCADIQSYYTLIHAGSPIEKIDKNYPAQVFNHVIVTVPFDNDTLFLECTGKNIPCGYMGTFTQNREAFIISDKPHFVRIPALTESEMLSSTKTETNLADLSQNIRWKVLARGDLYSRYLSIFNNLSNANIERYLSYFLPGKWQLVNYKIEDTEQSLPEIRLSSEMRAPRVVQEYGEDVFISQYPRSLPAFEKPEERTQTVQIDYPLCYADTNIYLLPQNKEWQLKASSGNVESKFGKYRYEYTLNDNKLMVIKYINVFSGDIDLDEYAGFYGFIEKIKNIEKQSIHLIQKTK